MEKVTREFFKVKLSQNRTIERSKVLFDKKSGIEHGALTPKSELVAASYDIGPKELANEFFSIYYRFGSG